MSISLSSQIKFWANLDHRQHWRIGCKGIEVISSEVDHTKAYLTRLSHHLSSFVYGENSLAFVISQMTTALNGLSAKDSEGLDSALLKSLSDKVTAKVNQYNQRHGRIYRLFMRMIQRDVNASYAELRRKIYTTSLLIQNIINADAEAEVQRKARAIEAEALRKARIPTDATTDLDPLLKDHRFTSFSNSKKRDAICIYIHLLPLVRHIEASFSDLVDILTTNESSPGFHNRSTFVAVELIKRKKGYTLQKDLFAMLLLVDDCGLTSYSYHGTNLYALENIVKNGLGDTSRDYDASLVPDPYSGSKVQHFYAAGQINTSYDYSLRSPEWAYLAEGNESAPAAAREAARKYQACTEVALIQFRRAPTKKLSIKEIAGRVNYAQTNRNHAWVFEWSVASNEVNEKVQGSTFRPLQIVYYRLPKLK